MALEQLEVWEIVRDAVGKKLDIPEFQREFVWDPERVKFLAESLYRDYPVGSFLLWDSSEYQEAKTAEGSQASVWIVDGQQRTTALAILLGQKPYWWPEAEDWNKMLDRHEILVNVLPDSDSGYLEFARPNPIRRRDPRWVRVTDIAYYEGKQADFWFRLGDIRRLVANDTPAVIAELRKLRNVRYHDRPVSLYGGIVDLPLIVHAEEELAWFADTATLLDGRLWVEYEAQYRGETERMAQELRDNLLGTAVWSRLEPTTRSFLASAEAVFRARRNDPQFDFSGPAIEYAKGVETELNALIFPALRRVLKSRQPNQREVRGAEGRIDLGGRVPHQTLGSVKVLLEKEEMVKKGLRQALDAADVTWLLGELPDELRPLSELRNPAAHRAVVSREETSQLREDVLGIGHEGLLVRIARAKMRSDSA